MLLSSLYLELKSKNKKELKKHKSKPSKKPTFETLKKFCLKNYAIKEQQKALRNKANELYKGSIDVAFRKPKSRCRCQINISHKK